MGCSARSLPRHFLASAFNHTEGPQYAFLKAGRNLSGPMGFPNQNQTLGWDQTASRWSAPGPGKRTRREDHAPSHRPQMSSDRLFLDRVARQHCPSPLHRHTQVNMHSSDNQAEGDISTLPAWGHLYFALTIVTIIFDNPVNPGVPSLNREFWKVYVDLVHPKEGCEQVGHYRGPSRRTCEGLATTGAAGGCRTLVVTARFCQLHAA